MASKLAVPRNEHLPQDRFACLQFYGKVKRHLERKIADPLRAATERQVLSPFESALSRWHGIRLRVESVFTRQALATADFSEEEWLLFQSDSRNLRRCFRGFAGRNRKNRRHKRADTHFAI